MTSWPFHDGSPEARDAALARGCVSCGTAARYCFDRGRALSEGCCDGCEHPPAGGDRANDTLRAEVERLRAALEDVASIHGKNAWHPDTKYPTPLAREWHNGYITCAATVSLKATAALDPVQKAEDDRLWRLGSNGTDSEWWAATGHCGGCGTVASSCDCDGSCGCWEDHGPPLHPWRSLPAQVAELTAENDRLRAALAAAVPAPDEDSREAARQRLVELAWDAGHGLVVTLENATAALYDAPAPAVPGEDGDGPLYLDESDPGWGLGSGEGTP